MLTKAEAAKLRRVVRRYVEAAIDAEFAGASHPDARAGIRQQYAAARQAY